MNGGNNEDVDCRHHARHIDGRGADRPVGARPNSTLYDIRYRTPLVIDVGCNFFERYKALRLTEVTSEGQFKWLHLTSDKETSDKLADLSGVPREMEG